MGKVLMLGVDGGAWSVIRPLIEAGLMPGLGELTAMGRWGTLESTIPYITCPAWLSMASGRNPGWIGAFGFVNLEPGSYSLRYYDYLGDPGLPEIWDILGDNHLSCGVLNLPVARNPRPINKYMVPGFLADEGSYRTHPKQLKNFLDISTGGYRIEVRGFSIKDRERTVKECMEVMEKRYMAMRSLLRDYPTDCFLGVFHLFDRVCHTSLNTTGLPLDPDLDEMSSLVVEFLQKLDDHIGSLVEEFLQDDDLLIILSDHGFLPCYDGFNLNTWLRREGYLKAAPGRGRLGRPGLNQRRIASALDRLGLLETAMRYTPKSLKRLVPEGIDRGANLSVIDLVQHGGVDWKDTAAIAFPNNAVYINTSDRPHGIISTGSEYDSLVEELRKRLLSVEDAATGERPFSAVHLREEIYAGPRLENAPDLMVESAEGWTTHAFHDPHDDPFFYVDRADHRREGIYVLCGKGITPGLGEDANIEDIAPTVLDFLGIEDRPAMDGRSLL